MFGDSLISWITHSLGEPDGPQHARDRPQGRTVFAPGSRQVHAPAATRRAGTRSAYNWGESSAARRTLGDECREEPARGRGLLRSAYTFENNEAVARLRGPLETPRMEAAINCEPDMVRSRSMTAPRSTLLYGGACEENYHVSEGVHAGLKYRASSAHEACGTPPQPEVAPEGHDASRYRRMAASPPRQPAASHRAGTCAHEVSLDAHGSVAMRVKSESPSAVTTLPGSDSDRSTGDSVDSSNNPSEARCPSFAEDLNSYAVAPKGAAPMSGRSGCPSTSSTLAGSDVDSRHSSGMGSSDLSHPSSSGSLDDGRVPLVCKINPVSNEETPAQSCVVPSASTQNRRICGGSLLVQDTSSAARAVLMLNSGSTSSLTLPSSSRDTSVKNAPIHEAWSPPRAMSPASSIAEMDCAQQSLDYMDQQHPGLCSARSVSEFSGPPRPSPWAASQAPTTLARSASTMSAARERSACAREIGRRVGSEFSDLECEIRRLTQDLKNLKTAAEPL